MAKTKEQFYTVSDVMKLLGVKNTKASTLIAGIKKEAIKEGKLYKGYPAGKIPRGLFKERMMIEEE